ncbi:15000_t:CDS:1, partial [Acaulospora morrowiae]
SNAIPLGGRAGIGGGAQIPPPPQLDTNTSSRGNFGNTSRFQMNFQKASSAESELGLLRSSTSASQPSSTGSQRKRRWDS